MRVKVNIEIWNDETQEELSATGVTKETIKNFYELAFKGLLDTASVGSNNEYSMNVEVME